NGRATVPPGATITFYTPHQKLHKGGDDYKIIQGTFGRNPDSVHRAFHTCPNLRLYPDDPTVVTYSESVKQPGTTLYWSSDANGGKGSLIRRVCLGPTRPTRTQRQ